MAVLHMHGRWTCRRVYLRCLVQNLVELRIRRVYGFVSTHETALGGGGGGGGRGGGGGVSIHIQSVSSRNVCPVLHEDLIYWTQTSGTCLL
jgi:hypothetical protein